MKCELENRRVSLKFAAEFSVGAERDPACNWNARIETPAPNSLRRLPAITFQQPTELFFATNLSQRNRCIFNHDFGPASLLGLHQQLILDSLVRSLAQVKAKPDFHHTIEMLRAKEQEVVETFPTDRADEAFHKSSAVRSSNGTFQYLNTLPLQGGIKARKLPVAIPLHIRHPQTLRSRLCHERFRLLDNPSLVRMPGGRRKDHASRGHVQKHQHKYLAKTCERQHFLAEEVALPQRRRVPLQEFIPCRTNSLRTRIQRRVRWLRRSPPTEKHDPSGSADPLDDLLLVNREIFV